MAGVIESGSLKEELCVGEHVQRTPLQHRRRPASALHMVNITTNLPLHELRVSLSSAAPAGNIADHHNLS